MVVVACGDVVVGGAGVSVGDIVVCPKGKKHLVASIGFQEVA